MAHRDQASRTVQPGLGRLALALALVVPLTACPTDDGGDRVVGEAEEGGTVVIGVQSDFSSFNPITNTALTSMEVINYMLFVPLVQYNEDFEPEPYLAREWDLEEDHVVFRLHEGLQWHDGEPVTAHDVEYTFEMAKTDEAASLIGSAFLEMVESAEVIDDHTIRFDFVGRHAQPLDGFAWAPAPRHIYEGTAPGALSEAPFSHEPVGNGPFRFVQWDRNQQLVLQANEEFPDELGGRPNVDRVVFRIIPEATSRVTELVTGGIDVNYSLHAPEAREIEQQGRAQLEQYPGREFTYIGWNTEREPFTDERVRRALGMAVDREQVIEGILFGYGNPAAGPIPQWSPLYPGVDPVPHDPDQARQLLEEAGWTEGPEGIRQRDGQPLQFRMMVNANNQVHQDIATVLQQQFRRVGAGLQIQSLEFGTLLQRHRDRDFESVYSNWTLDNFRIDPVPLFSCEAAEQEQSANRSSYCNPEADRLIMAGLRETDEGEAREIWEDFVRLLQQDQPITFMYWAEDLAGVGPRVQNVEMDARSKLVNVTDWFIPADRQRR